VEVCGAIENVAIFSGCNISSILLRYHRFGTLYVQYCIVLIKNSSGKEHIVAILQVNFKLSKNRLRCTVPVPRVPECLSHRRNWVTQLPPQQASVSLLGPKGGNTLLRLREWGDPMRRVDRKPGTLHTLWMYRIQL
jgi:hypothetical protein